MNCPSCNNEVNNKETVCPYCGQSLRSASHTASTPTPVQKPLTDKNPASKSGTSTNPVIANYDDLQMKRKQQSQTVLIAVISVLVVVLLVLVINIYFRNKLLTATALNDPSESSKITELNTQETMTEIEPATEESENSEFLFIDSDSRYLERIELDQLSQLELRQALNEIYARRGFIFTKEYWNTYFNSLSWYNGTIEPDDFSDAIFNEYETANKDLIVTLEKEKGYR